MQTEDLACLRGVQQPGKEHLCELQRGRFAMGYVVFGLTRVSCDWQSCKPKPKHSQSDDATEGVRSLRRRAAHAACHMTSDTRHAMCCVSS